MTGTAWVEKSGFLEGRFCSPTPTAWASCEMRWWPGRPGQASSFSPGPPVVAETYDGFLNDINGFHVKETDVLNASERPRPAPWRRAMWAAAPE